MAFDPNKFEAEVALGLIPSDQLPLLAQDALEAGFDGPQVVNMAILDPNHGWAIDQALPRMMEELGLHPLNLSEAGIRIAKERAQHILATGEDPLLSTEFFYRLWIVSGYAVDLCTVGNFDDLDAGARDMQDKRAMAHEALEDLLSLNSLRSR